MGSSAGKVTFSLVCNAKKSECPEGKFTIAWDRFINKYALHTASSPLKLKSEFHNRKFDSVEKVLDEWISTLKRL